MITRTVGFFLSEQPVLTVAEVRMISKVGEDGGTLICSCPDFHLLRPPCKHLLLIKARLQETGGRYLIPVAEDTDDTEIERARGDALLMRDLILRRGLVEVL